MPVPLVILVFTISIFFPALIIQAIVPAYVEEINAMRSVLLLPGTGLEETGAVCRYGKCFQEQLALGRGARSELGWGREGFPSVAATVVKQMLYSWMMDGYRELKSSRRISLS